MEAESLCFPHARSILMARTWDLKEGKGDPATRFFVSSLGHDKIPARRFAEKVRAHWNIENGTHWQRDVLWREDGHLMGGHQRAHILSSLRQVALFLLTAQSEGSKAGTISGATRRNLHNKHDGIQRILKPLRE